ncbi:hypothetical protein GCM10023172_01930 [Hymenobacter ginsengisoli]|uniref:Uncharacterized protein n=1 Tax=Hymenobacter ginsengisoli TaxID=1051626 RepID=A0ABP8PXV0_9BACT|nr:MULTISPECIES: hypothetical protein [unclassified Hymenobacter]MBO2030296.1 hypothetical protein [Hymenobacter sp. BT559]
MATATDVLRAKTDAELQFFVDNPGYYHADLVAAARQELRRRGLGPTPPSSEPEAVLDYTDEAEPGPSRRPLLIAAALLGFVGAGGAMFWASRPAAQPLAASQPGHLSPDSLKLESVAARPIPAFDVDKIVQEQVARVPEAEKQKAQELRQFRGLCRRFWNAETQTEFLTSQAHAGQAGPMFDEQTLVVRQTWRDWNKAVVYSYKFGPNMKDQLERMASTASSQQHILANFPGLLDGHKFLTDKEMVSREADVQDWLAGLRKVSPVTGKPYKATVLEIKL